MHTWKSILHFPRYSVSDGGTVMNEKTGRIRPVFANQSGLVSVSLNRDGVQYKRSVALLVADAFIKTARSVTFDTPINLNGDRFDNRVENLLWRPRWFACKYHKQFIDGPAGSATPIQDMHTKECFDSPWDAVTTFGLLEAELLQALVSQKQVWPTYQRFRLLA